MGTRLTQEEYQKIKDIKILDLEICDYWHVNILNLGWETCGGSGIVGSVRGNMCFVLVCVYR